MNRERAYTASAILIGLAFLYVGWANVGGLVPPFPLCGYVDAPSVHLGSNFALVYNGGCTPYEFAYEAFLSSTVTGVAFVAGGLHFGQLYPPRGGSRD